MEELERLGPAVNEELRSLEAAEGTYLPRFLVDAQLELASLPAHELSRRFADIVIATALRMGLGMTPRRLLAETAEGYKISDETWLGQTAPELRRALVARGAELPGTDDRKDDF